MNNKGKDHVIKNLKVDSIAADGRSIGRSDGQVVFVRHAIPGDIIDAQVIRLKKNYLEAIPVHFHKKSELRTDPFCQHFGICGGCRWQNMDYQAQLEQKQQQIVDQLERIGKIELPRISPIIPAKETTLYRNKLEFTFTPKRWLTKEEIESSVEVDRRGLGFHAPGRFDKIIDIEHCYLQPEPSNELRLFVKYFAINHNMSFYDIRKNEGFLRNLIIRTATTGEIMVILLVGEENADHIQLLCSEMDNMFPEITSLNYVVNTKKNEMFHDLEVVNFSGSPFITEDFEGIKYRIGPKSFFQTNSVQGLRLYNEVKKMADLSGKEIVYDLYCGAGTIANFIAKNSRKVIGIEFIAEAIENARENSSINGIDNTEFYAGDVAEMLNSEFIDRHGKPDVVITDPPRAGMHPDVVRSLVNTSPEHIIYISCNPATQARDLELMSAEYKVKTVQAIDMFPHTDHIENIVLLDKRY